MAVYDLNPGLLTPSTALEATIDDSKNASISASFTRDTDEIRIRAFVGLLYIHGFPGMNNYDINCLCDPIMETPSFRSTLSKNRFQFLHTCISSDDFGTRGTVVEI